MLVELEDSRQELVVAVGKLERLVEAVVCIAGLAELVAGQELGCPMGELIQS